MALIRKAKMMIFRGRSLEFLYLLLTNPLPLGPNMCGYSVVELLTVTICYIIGTLSLVILIIHYRSTAVPTGIVILFSILLFPILATKFGIGYVIGLPFDKIIKFHRVFAYWILFILLLHSMAGTLEFFRTFSYVLTSVWLGNYIYGFLSFAFFVLVFFFAMPAFRRTWWSLFRFIHFFWIPAFVFSILHSGYMMPFLAPGVVLLAIDFSTRFIQAVREVSSCQYEILPEKTLWISINTLRRSWFLKSLEKITGIHISRRLRPSQYIWISAPEVSLLGFHPYTVIENHSGDVDANDTSLLVRAAGDWSQAVYDIAERAYSPGADNRLTLTFYGPFGGVPLTDMTDMDNILLIGGGTGVAPLFALFNTLLNSPDIIGRMSPFKGYPPKILLVWGIREPEAASWLFKLLPERVQSADTFQETQIILYTEGTIPILLAENMPNNLLVRSGIPEIKDTLLHYVGRRTFLGFSGPQVMKRKIIRECFNLLSPKTLFYLHHDEFTF